ncbi:hypothetical protein OYT1_ch2274 [Ferriphaselus amnicola]|uniref:Uncharacterized protein n=1 Tax=Ferriphaselus amnicola TaxID=1188319 RepID=A0A2Z6GEB9_9PROT|nr:hypothetical protein [Ferriphaselus amnicola]BBE51790.1 hypothetical protein OYT1_ch2274 [Ferriphaselus amnicola]
MKLTKEQLELTRQWFDAVQDLNPRYLTQEDCVLANAIYQELGMRVPHSIVNMLPEKSGASST